jgi:ornithine carbamoyltransferase
MKYGKKKITSLLEGKTLAMIFQKPSTRTRVSFEVAMFQLGGHAIFLSGQELQLKRGETVADTSRTLSRYVDAVMIRANRHQDIVEFAKYSSVPVINGLSDLEHPCQVLGDVFTILEKKLEIKPSVPEKLQIEKLKDLKIVFVGDGNNISNSLMLLCSILGMNLVVCTPSGYEPDKNIYSKAIEISKLTKAKIELSNDPQTAVVDADFIYTDVWTSMGKEEERERRKQVFRTYQINKELLQKTNKDTKILHCLPAVRGEEVTDEVIDGPQSIVFDQAENRLHIQKAILLYLMK